MVRTKIAILLFAFCEFAAAASNSTAAAASKKPYALKTSDTPPILINNKQDIIIDGVKISNPNGNCIEINGSKNITIKNSVIGPCKGAGIELNNSNQIVIEKNNITNSEINISTNYANNVLIFSNYINTGQNNLNINRSSSIKIILNFGTNFMAPFPRSHFIQFDNVSGAGNEILCNTADAYPGMPDPATVGATPYIHVEDIINLWQSNGTAASPIFVAYNRMRGGSSRTGSGIMLGDGAGSYQTAYKNVVVNPWNAGIAVAGGNNIRIDSNKIFFNLSPNVAGAGMYINNFYSTYGSCYNITHNKNQVKWSGTTTLWNTNTCSNISGTETNNYNDTTLTEAIFDQPIAECKAIANSRGYNLFGWQ